MYLIPKFPLRRRLGFAPAIAAALALAALLGSMPSHGQQSSAQAVYDEAGKALDAGDAAKAVDLYQQYLRQMPESVNARVDLGAALAAEGRYQEAAQQDRDALARSPK